MQLELRSVGVTYRDQPVLRDVSFSINPGERIALIGESGAGKSTIAKLLMCARDPDQGEILLDGEPLVQYRRDSVLRFIGVILQRPELISGTVRENVLLSVHGRDICNVSDTDIWHILDTVSPQLRFLFGDEGLDREVGKQGLSLSGGQQQRLCIARALIKKPRFLIVDEATASLDAHNQAMVQKGIELALGDSMSALVIAHRLSTLRRCTKFIVLKSLQHSAADESQIDAVSSSMEHLYEQSSIFRNFADHEGIRF